MSATAASNSAPAALPAPGLVDQMFEEAVRRHGIGQTTEAELLYRAIIGLQVTHAGAAYNLGVLCHLAGRPQDAINAYQHAIAIRADYPEALSNLGALLKDHGKPEEAVPLLHQALTLRPDYTPALLNLGAAQTLLGQTEQALASYRQLLALNPDDDAAHANIAGILLRQGDAEAGAQACETALAINRAQELAWVNLSGAHALRGRFEDATQAARQAIALRPGLVEAHLQLARLALLQGDFATGWAEHEWRWQHPSHGWRRRWLGQAQQPQWAGEPLEGRTILVYAEPGLGETLQFARYLPLLTAQGAHVVCAVQPSMTGFIQANFPDVTVMSLNESKELTFDLHCPMASLPGAFGTRVATIPGPQAYLRADPAAIAKWQQQLPGGRRRVGLVWSGELPEAPGARASPGLSALLPLLATPGTGFVGLQLGAGREELMEMPENLVDLGGAVEDFGDIAGVLAGLDLLISADAAPLHLAGAMGVPAWGMVPAYPNSSWLLGRNDSPWYGSVKLFRQGATAAGWRDVVAAVQRELG